MKVKPKIAKKIYDDDDRDDFEYDEYLDRLEQRYPTKTLKELLSENNMTYDEALECLNNAGQWFDEMLERISAPNRHKLTVCNSFCEYLEKNSPDNDDYLFWRLCLSCKSNIFFDSFECEEEEERINEYLLLLRDMGRIQFIYVNHSKGRKKFKELVSNITFSSNPIGKISLTTVKKVARKLKYSGKYLDDNLEKLTARINHSKELSQIAPVVFYSAFTRYRKRMMEDPDLDINFKNAFNFKPFGIYKNDNKNIKNFYLHLNIFLSFADALCSGTDETYLNVEGFNCMSNICECRLIDWSDYECFRPPEQELSSDYFTCFINGLQDNPCYVKYNIAFDDIICFEDYDNKKAAPMRIYPKIRDYIDKYDEICGKYRNMIINSNTEDYITLVNDVLENSGIYKANFTAEMYGLVHTIIMHEIMLRIDENIQRRLLGFINCFDEFAFAEDMADHQNVDENDSSQERNGQKNDKPNRAFN